MDDKKTGTKASEATMKHVAPSAASIVPPYGAPSQCNFEQAGGTGAKQFEKK